MTYERHADVVAGHPVLIIGVDGWIDAGLGAGTAIETLLETIEMQTLVSFDIDDLVDHRSRRPIAHIVNGVNEKLIWPSIELKFGHDKKGNDILVLTGPEPDLHWQSFAREVVEVALTLNVRLAVGLGAFPAPVPHTREVRLVASATDAELAARIGTVPGSVDVPAGIQAVLEQGLAQAGIPAIGIWARVPHYASAMPYPAASAALIQGLKTLADLELDTANLASAASRTRSHIDELIANSEEHSALVQQLELQADEEERLEGSEPSLEDLANLPSGDELAAELERFLREK